MSRGLQASDPERQGPASPAAAAGRPPPYTAINVGSSVNQNFELSIKLSTSKLQKSIGEKKLIEGGKEKGISQSALSDTDSFGAATDDAHDPMDDDLSYLPTTALLHSAL